MYSSRGRNGYGQQQASSYTAQNSTAAALLGVGRQEAELGGYRAHGHVQGHPSAAVAAGKVPTPQLYGGQHSLVYGSGGQQISLMGTTGSVATPLEGQSSYVPSLPKSPRISEYPAIERCQYAVRHSAYLGRDLPRETADRYAESVTFGHEHQSKLFDGLEQATVLRQEEMLKARALQSASVEGGTRQVDYLATRAAVRRPAQDSTAYGGRIDLEPRNLSILSNSTYIGQHTSSILGAAPQQNVEDHVYAQHSSYPGYGVSLPPGRDYGAGKGLHSTPYELDYPSGFSGHVDPLRLDDRKDDRTTYVREMERRDRERDYLREREREREREKDRLREREREHERERERERQRERERARQREREQRERERERERREKERDRERRPGIELKQRTPPRVSRDRRGFSLSKDIRALQRESPHREVLHRVHSPVKQKKREYACKVLSFSVVEAKRDYLSLDKRYPRLYIPPECSMVAVYWPKKSLHLSLYTPVSFEHDFVKEIGVEHKGLPSTQSTNDSLKSGGQTTIWNAKVILMSGLSENALAELSSERIYDGRSPHFCNLLRFAVLKQNNTVSAIGGPWEAIDGGDPSEDDSSLIQTALRCAMNVTNLDLKGCQHWNRFLEIHYERVGRDGFFSHKEVSVLYVPDLSECLPSLDSWREQWLTHKRHVSERVHLDMLKKEVPGDKDGVLKDKKKLDKQKKNEPPSLGQSGDASKKDNVADKLKGKGSLVSEQAKEKEPAIKNSDVIGSKDEEKNLVNKVEGENAKAQIAAVGTKPGKKKIVKRIVKRKVPKKNGSTENAAEQNDANHKEDAGGQQEEDVSCTYTVKTSARDEIVKAPVGKDECSSLEVKTAGEPETAEENLKVKTKDPSTVVQDSSSKNTVKKKVVKRVPKIKANSEDNNNKVAGNDMKADETIIRPEDIKEEQNEAAVENQLKNSPERDSSCKKEETRTDKKDLIVSAMEIDSINQKGSENDGSTKPIEKTKLKEDKEGRDHVGNEPGNKTNKTVKEKKKIEEPPRHPGLILQTTGSKDSKLQSLSLSLDSLLDYSDKDIEESTFELSVFAESLYEMLQYEMGCRILAFLQKLRIKFVAKRNQGKRQRKGTSDKENEESCPRKRVKAEQAAEDSKLSKTENTDDTQQDGSKEEDAKTTEQDDEPKIEDEIDEEEPEEDPQEDEEMPEAIPQHDSTKEEVLDVKMKAGDAVSKDDDAQTEQNEQKEAAKQTSETVSSGDPSRKDKPTKVESKTEGTQDSVDKELLQAFRFFDRNRVGYIQVEDLRLIIHNLGKFLPHRDVKELVQSALLETNTPRDDRILYDKLVKMTDI